MNATTHKNDTERKEAEAAVWDSFYKQNRIPWKSAGLNAIVERYLKRYAQGKKILEIGCGSGEDAGGFLKSGFAYQGIDLSKEGIQIANLQNQKNSAQFSVADFFKWRPLEKFSVVYDKGVFHNLAGVRRRSTFVRRVASALEKGGIWISVCGSADHFDPKVPHGAIFLQHLIAPAEMYFEVLEVVKAPYGTENTKFDGWYCVFKRR